MPDVVFLLPDSSVQTVAADDGCTVMQAAVDNGIPGIVGECGGSAVCGTCHVYVDATFADRLPPVDLVEDEVLDLSTAERRPTSRLGCQMVMRSDLDGLTVEVPTVS